MAVLIDLKGRRFGRLVVTERNGSKGGCATWTCLCDCGKRVFVIGKLLCKGTTSSCGCYRKDALTKHGKAGSRTYGIWHAMVSRCHNKKAANFRNYGGRGISVCPEWHTIDGFFACMGEAPEGMSLERIDNEKGYSPENCRWATMAEHATNKRTNVILTFRGKSQTISEWSRELGVGKTAIHNRLKRGLSASEALGTPVLKRNRQKET